MMNVYSKLMRMFVSKVRKMCAQYVQMYLYVLINYIGGKLYLFYLIMLLILT